jgi:hypothetical protein
MAEDADHVIEVSGSAAAVYVARDRTRNGERLRVTARGGERCIRLDALALEALSWQSADSVRSWGAGAERAADGEAAPEDRRTETDLAIVNEFAAVKVRKVRAAGIDYLEVEAPRSGYKIRLDAAALEALCLVPPATVSSWLETPFGPQH